jgi:hypothetical protein
LRFGAHPLTQGAFLHGKYRNLLSAYRHFHPAMPFLADARLAVITV